MSITDFLRRVVDAATMKIVKHPDDRFNCQEKKPKIMKLFDNLSVAITKATHLDEKTKTGRIAVIREFVSHLWHSNIRIREVDDIRVQHIQSFIQHKLECGISKRTLQNKMVAIRNTLLACNLARLAADHRLTNQSLGLGEPRSIKIKAITHAEFEGAMRAMREKGSHCEAAALGLIFYFGLSAIEALESRPYLKGWKASIERGENIIEVIYGKRPRSIKVFDNKNALKAIHDAMNGNCRKPLLVNGVGMTATSALNRLNRELANVLQPRGFSAYSARYSFLQFQVDFYLSQGLSKKEATQRASIDMGHIDEDNRSAKKVYNLKR